jgi:hypothetical protein
MYSKYKYSPCVWQRRQGARSKQRYKVVHMFHHSSILHQALIWRRCLTDRIWLQDPLVIRIMNLKHQHNETFLPHFKIQSTKWTCSNDTNFRACASLMTLYINMLAHRFCPQRYKIFVWNIVEEYVVVWLLSSMHRPSSLCSSCVHSRLLVSEPQLGDREGRNTIH